MLLALFSACFLAQSNAAGMAVICDAPQTCGDCLEAAPEQQAYLLAQHIDERLYNREARKTFDELAMVHYTQRSDVLRQAAAEAGLQRCAFADVMDTLAAEDEEQ